MTRCSKCNGCVSGFDEYRPSYCDDKQCPQGDKEPEELRATRQERLSALFGTKIKELNK